MGGEEARGVGIFVRDDSDNEGRVEASHGEGYPRSTHSLSQCSLAMAIINHEIIVYNSRCFRLSHTA